MSGIAVAVSLPRRIGPQPPASFPHPSPPPKLALTEIRGNPTADVRNVSFKLPTILLSRAFLARGQLLLFDQSAGSVSVLSEQDTIFSTVNRITYEDGAFRLLRNGST